MANAVVGGNRQLTCRRRIAIIELADYPRSVLSECATMTQPFFNCCQTLSVEEFEAWPAQFARRVQVTTMSPPLSWELHSLRE